MGQLHKPDPLTDADRRTVVHVARLWVEDGVLRADRDTGPISLAGAVG